MTRLLTVILFSAMLAACASKPLVPYTTDTPPLVLLPASEAGVRDERGRFREITCAVLEEHGKALPHYRPCEEALTRLGDEAGATGAPVDLGPSRRNLVAAMVPGIGWVIPEQTYQQAINEAGRVARFDPDRDTAVEAIRRTSARVLLIHGTNDWVVPHRHSARTPLAWWG